MTTVGQIEKKTQRRVVQLFRKQLGYDYLGDWTDREGNRTTSRKPCCGRSCATGRGTTRR